MALINKTSGLTFPITLTSGSHTMVDNLDLIKDSIKIIIAWPLRTRQFNGNFGSRIFEVLEDQNDDVLITLLRRFVLDAITRWERRIELQSLEISKPSPESLVFNLVYRVKELDIQDSLFYNYYIG